jgi:hypothetical protein
MSEKNLPRIEKQILKIKRELMELGELRPGSLSKQYNVCGSPNCKCKDKTNPQKHGPYYQISYARKGKSSSSFVRKEFVAEVKEQLSNYKRLKKLVDQWIDLGMQYSEEKMKLAKQNKLKQKKICSGKIRR